MNESRTRWIVGCMTGTSLDGLDVALVRIDASGMDMRVSFVALHSKSLGHVADQLRSLAEGKPAPALTYMQAARELGQIHAEAIDELLGSAAVHELGDVAVDAVVAHGQTIHHAPPEASRLQGDGHVTSGDSVQGLSWQLFDPWPLVRRLRVPVCYDLRQADLIAGGQGAPITPLSDWVMYGQPDKRRVVLNLGGVANAAVVEGDARLTRGCDISLCNIVIDGAVQHLFTGTRYDKDGHIAAAATLDADMVDRLLHEPFMLPVDSGRSLGREDYDARWLREIEVVGQRKAVVLRAAVEAVATRVGQWIASSAPDELILAGGGARNPVLADRIAHHAGLSGEQVMMTDDLGIPCEAREAMAMAVLGAMSQDGLPITLSQVTGAADPGRAGVWAYP